MITEQDHDRFIQEILVNFDFEKVFTVMKALDWKWADVETPSLRAIPALYVIKAEALRLLRSCKNELLKGEVDSWWISCGGLKAHCHIDKTDGSLFYSLEFVVAEFDYYD